MAGDKCISQIEFLKGYKVLPAKLICLKRECQFNTSGCLIRCKLRLCSKFLLVNKGSFPSLLVHQFSADRILLAGYEVLVGYLINNFHFTLGGHFFNIGFCIRRFFIRSTLCFISLKGSMGSDFREVNCLVLILDVSMAADLDSVEIEVLKDNRCFSGEDGGINLEGQFD